MGIIAINRIDHVEKAATYEAIETLLITNDLLRSYDVNKRKRSLELVSEVKKQCGNVIIFSSEHETGKELQQYTGIAAILRYSIPEIDQTSLENITEEIKSVRL